MQGAFPDGWVACTPLAIQVPHAVRPSLCCTPHPWVRVRPVPTPQHQKTKKLKRTFRPHLVLKCSTALRRTTSNAYSSNASKSDSSSGLLSVTDVGLVCFLSTRKQQQQQQHNTGPVNKK